MREKTKKEKLEEAQDDIFLTTEYHPPGSQRREKIRMILYLYL